MDILYLFHYSRNMGYLCRFKVSCFVLFFNLKKKYSEVVHLMLAILNKLVTNLGTRCQAHTTICADLGLFLLCLTKVEDRFDYFRP